MFDFNYTDLSENYESTENKLTNQSIKKSKIDCTNGWMYDKSVYQNTVVMEVCFKLYCYNHYSLDTILIKNIIFQWDLVCEKDFYGTLGLVLFGIGGIIGNYIFGYLQDSLGRRPSFFIYLLIECVFGVATAFSQSFIAWVIFRIGVGFTVPAILATPYVLGK